MFLFNTSFVIMNIIIMIVIIICSWEGRCLGSLRSAQWTVLSLNF